MFLTESPRAETAEEDIIHENEVLKLKIKQLEGKLKRHQQVSSCLVTHQNDVIDMFKSVIGNGDMLAGMLSISERNEIKFEIPKAKDIFDLGIREKKQIKDLQEIIDPRLFNNLLQKFKEQCPTIMNFLEQLLLSKNASRNVKKTEVAKMEAGVHLPTIVTARCKR